MSGKCIESNCEARATSQGRCAKHYAAWRLREIRGGRWSPKRQTNKAGLSPEEAAALERLTAYRRTYGVWPSGYELIQKTPKIEHRIVAAGLRKLLHRGLVRYAMFPTAGARRLSRRAFLPPVEKE